ncbi:hypothetical protein HN587_03080 [Candidatus Woesearchaeota archaeon]|jgi:hypothetical protein|nr:hypothetical protein [Candidatus Woesearchaeota archaeon]
MTKYMGNEYNFKDVFQSIKSLKTGSDIDLLRDHVKTKYAVLKQNLKEQKSSLRKDSINYQKLSKIEGEILSSVRSVHARLTNKKRQLKSYDSLASEFNLESDDFMNPEFNSDYLVDFSKGISAVETLDDVADLKQSIKSAYKTLKLELRAKKIVAQKVSLDLAAKYGALERELYGNCMSAHGKLNMRKQFIESYDSFSDSKDLQEIINSENLDFGIQTLANMHLGDILSDSDKFSETYKLSEIKTLGDYVGGIVKRDCNAKSNKKSRLLNSNSVNRLSQSVGLISNYFSNKISSLTCVLEKSDLGLEGITQLKNQIAQLQSGYKTFTAAWANLTARIVESTNIKLPLNFLDFDSVDSKFKNLDAKLSSKSVDLINEQADIARALNIVKSFSAVPDYSVEQNGSSNDIVRPSRWSKVATIGLALTVFGLFGSTTNMDYETSDNSKLVVNSGCVCPEVKPLVGVAEKFPFEFVGETIKQDQNLFGDPNDVDLPRHSNAKTPSSIIDYVKNPTPRKIDSKVIFSGLNFADSSVNSGDKINFLDQEVTVAEFDSYGSRKKIGLLPTGKVTIDGYKGEFDIKDSPWKNLGFKL